MIYLEHPLQKKNFYPIIPYTPNLNFIMSFQQVADPRFKHIARDPRYKSMTKNDKKILVDKRYRHYTHSIDLRVFFKIKSFLPSPSLISTEIKLKSITKNTRNCTSKRNRRKRI